MQLPGSHSTAGGGTFLIVFLLLLLVGGSLLIFQAIRDFIGSQRTSKRRDDIKKRKAG